MKPPAVLRSVLVRPFLDCAQGASLPRPAQFCAKIIVVLLTRWQGSALRVFA